jgi:hypothetical protein
MSETSPDASHTFTIYSVEIGAIVEVYIYIYSRNDAENSRYFTGSNSRVINE